MPETGDLPAGLGPAVPEASAFAQHLAGERKGSGRRQGECAFAFALGYGDRHAGMAGQPAHFPVLNEAVGVSRPSTTIAGIDNGASHQSGTKATTPVGSVDAEGKLDDIPPAERDMAAGDDGELVVKMGENAVMRRRQLADISLNRRIIDGKTKPQPSVRRAQAEEMLAVESVLPRRKNANWMHNKSILCCTAQSGKAR